MLYERISAWPWIRDRRPLGGDPVPPVEVVDTSAPGLKPEGDVFVALPGTNFPPRGAVPFDLVGDADIGASATADVITFTVPAGWQAKIEDLGFSAESPSALADLTWSLLAGGNSVPFMVNNSAVIGSVNEPARMRIVISGHATPVILRVLNSGLATRHFFARMTGYYFKERQERRA